MPTRRQEIGPTDAHTARDHRAKIEFLRQPRQRCSLCTSHGRLKQYGHPYRRSSR